MKQYLYVIQGAPKPSITVGDSERRSVWDCFKEERLKSKINIENQHEQQQGALMEKPVEFDATFYMPIGRHDHEDLPSSKPSLINLFNFIDYAFIGTVYAKDWNITTITLKKVFDTKPRTEITLREL